MVKSTLLQSATDNTAEHYNLHRCESAAQHLEFIDSILPNNKELCPAAQCRKSAVCGPKPKHRQSKAANECRASMYIPGAGNPAAYVHHILSSGEITAVRLLIDFIIPSLTT